MSVPVPLFRTLLLTAALASCGRPADPPAPAVAEESSAPVQDGVSSSTLMATFTCTDSTVIYAIFRTDSAGGSEVSLAIGDERLRLPQAISASGARYADSATVFWNKGNQATFEWGGITRQCATP